MPPRLRGHSAPRTCHSAGTPPAATSPQFLLLCHPHSNTHPKTPQIWGILGSAGQNHVWHQDVPNGTPVPTLLWGQTWPGRVPAVPKAGAGLAGSGVAAPCWGHLRDTPVPGRMPGVHLGTLGSPGAPGVSRFPLSSALPFYHPAQLLFLADQN